jgi:ribosomal protein L40E
VKRTRKRGEIEARLARGIEAARVGDRKRARHHFIHVIELDQYNEQAWLWLNEVVDSMADRRVCLENILLIDPSNTSAATELEHLLRQPRDRSTPPSALPRLAALEEWEEKGEWEWRGKQEEDDESTPRVSSRDTPSPRTGQVCVRCGYRNPGWVFVCDRCGGDLRPADLRRAVSSGSKPRDRDAATLVAAWGGLLTFNPLFAFQPEIELASWGRSLAALFLAAFFASIWRAVISTAPELVSGTAGPWRQVVITVLRCAIETVPPALLLSLVWVPIALLSWTAARLAGGRQGLKRHAHLTAVAFSGWFILTALLVPLLTVVPDLLEVDGASRFGASLQALPALVGAVAGLIGFVWLIQAVQTAHRLPPARTLLAAFLIVTLAAVLLFGLDVLFSEWLARLADMLLIPFVVCPG